MERDPLGPRAASSANRTVQLAPGPTRPAGGLLTHGTAARRSLWQRPAIALAATLGGFLAFAVAGPLHGADAHVNHPGSAELLNGPAGPYHLLVEAVPVVGSLHVTVSVEDGGTREPVTGAEVWLRARPADQAGAEIGPALARVESLARPSIYAATLGADTVGEWLVQVTIRTDLGETTELLPVRLSVPGSSSRIWWSLFLALVVLATARLIWASQRRRRRRRRRNQPR